MKRNCWQIAALSAAVLALIASAGCPGTDIVSSGNSNLVFEVVVQGTTDQAYDCTEFQFSNFRIRPLDGICEGGFSDGEPCLDITDCLLGECVGSQAADVIGSQGILIPTGPRGTLDGEACVATPAGGGTCADPFFPPVACTTVDDCDTDLFPNNSCEGTFAALVDAQPLVLPAPTVLSSGLYEISSLSVGQAVLYVDNPLLLKRCGQLSPIILSYPEEDQQFTVKADGTTVVRFVINVDALEDAMPAQSSCPSFFSNITSILEIEEGS